ncbi:MAG: AAA family ATPase, partial [Hydrogenophaga sp.]|nr:AAA family ATPase [Hydrogenophaga sp.]
FHEISGEPSPDERKYAARFRPEIEEHLLDQPWKGGEIVHTVLAKTYDLFFEHPIEYPAFRFWEGLPIRGRQSNVPKDSQRTMELPCEVLAAYSYQGNIRQTSALSAASDLVDAPSLVKLLQQFDPDVRDVVIRSSMGLRPAIYLKHARLGLAPLSIFGDAMRRAVLLASTLSGLPAGGVLLMDEAEAGIHVGAQQRFFAWILQIAKQRQVQVFMTTHSLEALDALLMAMPGEAADDDVVVFQLHRHQAQEPASDQVQVKRFAGDLLHRLRFDRGLDVR